MANFRHKFVSCSRLLVCVCAPSPAAAIDQYLLPAAPLQARIEGRLLYGTDGQTDTVPLRRPCRIPVWITRRLVSFKFTHDWLGTRANSHRHARHDTDRTVLSCLARRCELSRIDRQTAAFRDWSVSECVGRRSATAGRTPTQNAHLSGRLNSHRLIRHRQDRLVWSGAVAW